MIKIIFNDNQIEYNTGKATLLKVPNSKKKIWIPNSMIRSFRNRNSAIIYDDFIYHTAGGTTMTAEEVVSRFGPNIIKSKIHKPEKLEAQHVEADDSLKR